MQAYAPATLHCRSPGCDQKWHIQSFPGSDSLAVLAIADGGYNRELPSATPSHVLQTSFIPLVFGTEIVALTPLWFCTGVMDSVFFIF